MSKKDENKFPGFPQTMKRNFWMYPRVLDGYWCELSGSEQKVLDFILRRTWGFAKQSDSISLEQFQHGVGESENWIDKGTGLSKPTIVRSLKSLEEKGYITITKGRWVNRYILVTNLSSGESEVNRQSKNLSDESKRNEHTIDNSIDKEAIENIHNIYKELVCSGARLTQKGREKIEERLIEFSPEKLEKAMERFSQNAYLMEMYAGRGVAWFFDSEDRIDSFINVDSFTRVGGD